MKTKEEKEEIINATFLDKSGKETKVSDIIDKSDCWKTKDKWVITFKGAKRIAEVAGISKNYEIEESEHIVPDYKNELAYIVRTTIHCKACASKTNPDECIHGERSLTATGEANRLNTGNRGRTYLRRMAEKRGYVISLLEHLGLYSAIYCEDEAEAFEKKSEPKIIPGTKSFEELIKEINAILEAKDTKSLLKVGKKIKAGKKLGKYTPLQLDYLRNLFNIEHAKKLQNF
jgi:hypothetical protein